MYQKLSIPTSTLDPSSPRLIRLSPSKLDNTLNRAGNLEGEEQGRERQLTRELTKKHSQSNKNIVFHRVPKSDAQNQECWESGQQRQIAKLKAYYENQIRNQGNGYKRTIQELELRCKGFEKERNDWKDVAMKLKMQIETKISNLQSKQIAGERSGISIGHGQQNNAGRANNVNQGELAKLRSANSQMAGEISRLKDEIRYLKDEQARIHLLAPRNLPIPSANPNFKMVTSRSNQKRQQSPNRSRSSGSQSPSKRIDSFHRPQKHGSKGHHSDNDKSHDDPQKQIQRLKKLVRKMEKLISQRNEQLMKQKTKALNLKYMRQ